MKELVISTPANPVINVDEAFANLRTKTGGILGVVYANKLSILFSERSDGNFIDRWGFHGMVVDNKLCDKHTMTSGFESLQERIKKEIVGQLDKSEMKLYFFDNLKDMAESILSNGWN